VSAEEKRQSDRVIIELMVWLSAKDVAGEEFSEQARTLAISRHGATIVVDRKLAPGQQVTLSRGGNDRTAQARVVGQIGGQAHGLIYGIALPDAGTKLWGIRFPPLAEADQAVLRLLLECTVCQTREVLYLNELEAEVFEANRGLSRPCQRCSAWTDWIQSPHEATAEPSEATKPSAPAQSKLTQEKRKDVRVPLRKQACVRHPGFGEEVVAVEDISRGGLSFVSKKSYLEGSRVEVAVPYSPTTANIFIAGRIVRSRELPEKGFRSYGVAYIRTRKP
jgi:hypothetical protein